VTAPAIPQRANLTTTYSSEVERIRRLELVPPGTAGVQVSDWTPFAIDDYSGQLVGFYRIHYGCVFLSGDVPRIVSESTAYPGWREATPTPLPDYARPPVDYTVWALSSPDFNPAFYDPGIPPTQQPWMMQTRVTPEGEVLYPASYFDPGTGHWLHQQPGSPFARGPSWSLVTSYFPLG
jgi:hypothetical protein